MKNIEKGIYVLKTTDLEMGQKIISYLFPEATTSIGYTDFQFRIDKMRDESDLHFVIADFLPYKAEKYDGVLGLSQYIQQKWLLTFENQAWTFQDLGLRFDEPTDFVLRQIPSNFETEKLELSKMEAYSFSEPVTSLSKGIK